MSTTIESLELEIKQNGTNAAQGIDALRTSLTKLKEAIPKGGLGLTSVANQISKLNTAVNGSNAEKLGKFADSLSKLSNLGTLKISSTIAKQLTNIGTAANGLQGVDFSGIEQMANALAPLSEYKATGLTSTINALNKLPQISSALGSMDWGSFTSQIQQLTDALEPLSTRLGEMSASFSKLPSSFTKAINATNKLTAANSRASRSYLEFYAKCKMAISAVRGIANTIAGWITSSTQYIEDMNLFNVSMGQYAQQAYNYAQAVSEALGIDPGEFMRNQGVFNTIIKGFGVASDQAYMMSENLTRLSYDIASFYNISTEDAFAKVQSGIAGELEPLRRIGYDLSIARLEQEAFNRGITKSVSDMTQAEKAQLRYCAILTQVTDVQGDMTRTIASPANQLRVLRAQLTLCARSLGNIFLPLLKLIIPYAIAAAKAIRTLIDAVAKLFGFELADYTDAFNNTGSSIGSVVEDTNSEIDDTTSGLGKASDAAKKLKNNLLGIDELNIISPETADSLKNGTGSDLGDLGGTGDLGIDLPSYEWDLANAEVNQVIENIKKSLSEIEAIASGFALAIGTILVVSGVNIPLGIGLMALGAVGLVHVIATNWNSMSERLANVLATVTAVLGGFLLAIGAVLAFSGVNLPLGIGLMVAGAAMLATSVVINWKFLGGKMENVMDSLKKALIGVAIGLLAIGAVLAFTGANLPLGLGLMATGAVGLATAANPNWSTIANKVAAVLKEVGAALGAALFAVGAILAFSGIAIPAGIALMVAGMATTAGAVALNWGSIVTEIKRILKEIGAVAGASLFAIGLILCLSGVGIPVGIALIAAGVASTVAAVALNWGSITDKIKEVLNAIKRVAGSASKLALGLILAASGIGLPLGIALIASGVKDFVTGETLNWNELVNKVKDVLSTIQSAFEKFGEKVGGIISSIGEGISSWAENVVEFFTKGIDGKNFIDNIKEWFVEIGEQMWEGIKEGWENSALKKICDWIANLVQAFKDALGIHSPSTVFRDEIGVPMAEGLLEGIAKTFKNIGKWVKTNIIEPISNAIKNNPISDIVVNIKNTASEWWNNAKSWWNKHSGEGLSVEGFVSLAKKGWSSVKEWIGNIPTLPQAISLAKDKWTSVKKWIGDIPVVSQGIDLAKQGWQTVKSWVGDIPTVGQAVELTKEGWKSVKTWVGNIPTIQQTIKLVKSGWSDVKSWIGNLPVISQAVNLVKSGWSSVKSWIGSMPTISQAVTLVKSGWSSLRSWIGSIPVISQAIALVKSGWTTVQSWIGSSSVIQQGVSLFKSGWSTVSAWVRQNIGGSVSVVVNLVKGWWGSIKNWLGLSGGGTVSSTGAFKLMAGGGIITPNSFWDAIPKYANGANLHGSMFVAGENGAEMVGHVNGSTEVLNRFQMGQIMHSSIMNGMAQFVPIWQGINNTLISSANAIIRSVLVSANAVNTSLANDVSCDPSGYLSQSVYDESESIYQNARDDSAMVNAVRDFYSEYVEPTLREIATDTKRQADKNEQTIVQIGNRSINDAVVTQKRANGYVFA